MPDVAYRGIERRPLPPNWFKPVREERQARQVKLVTTQEICRTLGITPLAVLGWRRGSNRRNQLRTVIRPVDGSTVHRVLFVEAELLGWLQRYKPELASKWKTPQR